VIVANAVPTSTSSSRKRPFYGVEKLRPGHPHLVQTSLRSIIGEMDLDDALSSRTRSRPAEEGHFRRYRRLGHHLEDGGNTGHQPFGDHAEGHGGAGRGERAPGPRSPGPRARKSAAILEADGRLEASRRDARPRWCWPKPPRWPSRRSPRRSRTRSCRPCIF
jgi:hypothetical protein